MEYIEFVSVIEKEVNARLEGSVSAAVHKVLKNNGTWKRNITLKRAGCNMAPAIYLEEFYESFCEGRSIECIVEELLHFYNTLELKPELNLDFLSDYASVRRKILPKLINREQNSLLLENVPFVPWKDLAIVFYILLGISENGMATVLIRDRNLQDWNVTIEEISEEAMRNSPCLLPAELLPITDMIEELEENREKSVHSLFEHNGDCGRTEDEMYVLTNRLRNFGATCIAYPCMPEMIAGLLNNDYYALPSSIHEMIIVPARSGIGKEEFAEMICEINATRVEAEEILSEHPYYYDRKKGELSL